MSTISLTEENVETNLDKDINEIFSEQNVNNKKRLMPRLPKKSITFLIS